MKRLGLLAALAVVTLTACHDAAAPVAPEAALSRAATPAGTAIPGQYIVVFRDHVADVEGEAERLTAAHGGARLYTYTSALRGFAARLSEQAAAALARHPDVDYVEADQVVWADATQSSPPWGLDRIDERDLPLSGSYTYTRNGSGVRAYIIDTGISTGHTEFGGRASNVYDAFGGNGNDCNGHGTHVAGTVGAATYGVAKGSYLRGVRVLDCNGSGSTSGVIAGVDWVRTNRINPAVANMSLGGGYSSSMNTAVNNLANSGVFVAVAAGNSNADACNASPASASAAYAVAASTSSDAKASYSNWGSCVDIYAPGSGIKSTWLNGGTNTISGTSMASPHVAGVAVLYKHANGDVSSSTIRSWLTNNATTGKITGNPSGTPNRLLFKSTL